jgi:hypothetical protein
MPDGAAQGGRGRPDRPTWQLSLADYISLDNCPAVITIEIMAGSPNDVVDFEELGRMRWGLAVLGLLAALAAFALPLTGHTAKMAPEISSVLVIGSLAVLAGHRWAVAIVVLADILLLGVVWPLAVYTYPPSGWAQAASVFATAGTLPGLVLLRRSLGPLVDLVTGGGRSARFRATTAGLSGALCVLWLVLPALG